MRAELYMEFVEPCPFNVFPSPKSIGRVVLKLVNFIGEKCCGKRDAKQPEKESKQRTTEDDIDEQLRKELENLADQMILENNPNRPDDIKTDLIDSVKKDDDKDRVKQK